MASRDCSVKTHCVNLRLTTTFIGLWQPEGFCFVFESLFSLILTLPHTHVFNVRANYCVQLMFYGAYTTVSNTLLYETQ